MPGFSEGGPALERAPTLINTLNGRLLQLDDKIGLLIKQLEHIYSQIADDPQPSDINRLGPVSRAASSEKTVNILNNLESSINTLTGVVQRFNSTGNI